MHAETKPKNSAAYGSTAWRLIHHCLLLDQCIDLRQSTLNTGTPRPVCHCLAAYPPKHTHLRCSLAAALMLLSCVSSPCSRCCADARAASASPRACREASKERELAREPPVKTHHDGVHMSLGFPGGLWQHYWCSTMLCMHAVASARRHRSGHCWTGKGAFHW
jgi:hypothetical protein